MQKCKQYLSDFDKIINECNSILRDKMGTTKNIENNFVSRFKIIFYIFLVVGFVAIGRIFYLQFLKKMVKNIVLWILQECVKKEKYLNQLKNIVW